MNTDEKSVLLKAREYIVAKSNQIVQKSRYDFTVNEQKTILYIKKINNTNDKNINLKKVIYSSNLIIYYKKKNMNQFYNIT